MHNFQKFKIDLLRFLIPTCIIYEMVVCLPRKQTKIKETLSVRSLNVETRVNKCVGEWTPPMSDF